MAMNEEIARLTGSLVFKADYKQLEAFEKRLASVEGKLRAFGELANKKFNIKVTLDAKSLRAQLERAANAKVIFKNFSADMAAVDRMQKSISEKIGGTHINLKNVKLNISEVIGQRALLRQQLGNTALMIRVGINTKEANAALRAWKATTEQRFKLHINADISGAKLYRNAAATLRRVGARLGTFLVKSPQVRLTVDRAHLRAEIASVLAQIQREVRIKIDLGARVSGSAGSSSAARRSPERGAFRGGMIGGLARGFLPGLGAAYTISKLNEINQQQQGQIHAMMAVTGSAQAGAETKRRLDTMGNDIGFNSREMAPSFIKMIAAGQGSGFNQGQSEQIFKSMTEYGRVMGLNGEEMKGSLRAVEQMMNKGQIMAEELKGQLGERFPAAVALMAESQKMTIPELLKTMKAGQLSSKALLSFAELISKKARVGGALDLAKESTAAQQFRMENAVSTSIATFSKGGFDSATGRFFKYMAEALTKSQTLIKSLGAAFEWLMMPVYAVIQLFGDLGKAWPDLAAGIGLTSKELGILAGSAAMLLMPFGEVLLIVGALALAIEDLMTYNSGGQSVFGDWLKETPAAQKAMDDISQSWDHLKNSWNELTEGNKSFGEMSKTLKENFAAINFSDMFVATMRELKMIMDFVANTIDRIKGANDYSREASGPNAGETQLGLRFIKGLALSPEERKADLDKQRAQGYLPLSAADLQREADRKLMASNKTLPGINTPLMPGGEMGTIPTGQAGGPLTGLGGISSKIEHHGPIQIILQRADGEDDKLANKVRDVIQEVFQAYQPKEVL